jgi:HPt (histidine-containing phosphotransfer) domain-containing protein
MDAYLAKPVAIERLRATLERWLPIGDATVAAPSAGAGGGAAIDRSVLAAWMGDDPASIDAMLQKFRDSATESEQAINVAWRAADLAGLAAAAHRLTGAAQAVGATRLGAAAGGLEQAGRPATATAAATASASSLPNCVAQSRKSRADAMQSDWAITCPAKQRQRF